MSNNILRTIKQLTPAEKAYALDRVRNDFEWNSNLKDEIERRMFKEIEKAGIGDDLLHFAAFERYSFVEGCNYGGEIPILVKAMISAVDEYEKEELVRLVYGSDEDKIKSVKTEHVHYISISIYGETVSARIEYYNKRDAFPSKDLDAEQLQNDIEVYFSAGFSAMEAVLTLYSISLRSDENVERWISMMGGVFDKNLCLVS